MRVGTLLVAPIEHTVEVIASWGGAILELAAIAIILSGGVFATGRFVRHAAATRSVRGSFETFRRSLGHAILLGLEFLVAADIIGTVLIEPTFTNLGILAILVAVRTFLSLALTVEVEHRWPWQKPATHEPPVA